MKLSVKDRAMNDAIRTDWAIQLLFSFMQFKFWGNTDHFFLIKFYLILIFREKEMRVFI